MPFEPIAVVGQGCALPGALDPAALWDSFLHGRVSLTQARPEDWRLPQDWAALGADSIPMVGGLVGGFDEVFDASGLALPADQLREWDPALRWLVHAGRAALRSAGLEGGLPRAGLVLGNLNYPSRRLSAFAERIWQSGLPTQARLIPEGAPPDPGHRFCSGLPAALAARALGLGGDVLVLDAACASSLYAIKLACDRLHDRTSDLMLAGGLSGADSLLIHWGFAALSALSPTGRSRPFHPDADGLVPSEGATLVALMRLDDAVRERREVLGVIRGIGLANDGAAGGFLTPVRAGQERAMRAAYRSAGLDPASVTLLECHATGTTVGDAVELASAAVIFADCADLPFGSSKGNLGHLLTASAAAGLLKILAAMRTGIRPANVGTDEPIAAGGLRLLRENERWEEPRRAAISAFGFGGNNAHLILDAPDTRDDTIRRSAPRPKAPVDAAIVAIGARVGDGESLADLRNALLAGVAGGVARSVVHVEVDRLRFPPNDLAVAAPQALVLEAAREAVAGLRLPQDTMVLVGMGCDPDGARAQASVRHACWAAHHGVPDRADFGAVFSAEQVVGAMANVYANRIGVQLDLTGPAFAVSAEEASGPAALQVAARALRNGEVGAAIVGAVDLSAEAVHTAALGEAATVGDAAVVLVLKRLDDARRDGDEVIATLGQSRGNPADLSIGEGCDFDPSEVFGSAHAARGLIEVAVAALALQHRASFRAGRAADPLMAADTADAVTRRLGGPPVRTRLRAADRVPALAGSPPALHVFSGIDAAAAVAALVEGRASDEGPARLAVVADSPAAAASRADAARRWLLDGGLRPAGMAFRAAPIRGEVGYVFTNGSAARPRMGRELFLAVPSLVDGVAKRFGDLTGPAGWAYRDEGMPDGALDQILGVAVLAALQVAITRDVLAIVPSAALGYSSGESTALLVMGAWTRPEMMASRLRASEVFSRDLGGELRAVRAAWSAARVVGERWTTFMVDADAARVRAALDGEAAVHLMTINSPDTCVIGGEESACVAVLGRLGDPVVLHVDYDLAAHAPELAVVKDDWYDLHLLPTQAVPGVRFYSGATGESYALTAERVAQAITDQALRTIDFVALIEHAYADGVRVFVEHGPAGLCTGWIRRILGDRDHVAVALDGRSGESLAGLLQALAELAAAGVPMDLRSLSDLLSTPPQAEPGRRLPIAAHLEPVRATVVTKEATMAAAPVFAEPASAEPLTPAPGLSPASGSVPIHRSVSVSASESGGRIAATGPGAVLALAAVQHRLVASVHALHLAIQAEGQARFLAHHDRMSGHLFTAQPAFVRGQAAIAVPGPKSGRGPEPQPIPAEPPARAVPVAPESAIAVRPSPRFDRAQLEHLARGRISELFGPLFAVQDDDMRQTRMPAPPMLLADRVTGIDAEPGAMGTGRIWTETDLRADSWYLDYAGRMPSGLLIEAGQADLLLISWLGADLENRGRRVYRLLGCEATFHASSPGAGSTLDYEIRITGHAAHGEQRLFFFEYDCRADGRAQLSVRDGQAGFFTDEELASTGGVLWEPTGPGPEGSVDPVPVRAAKSRFTAEDVAAFAAGRPADCFGPGWRAARAHVRTPRIPDGRMLRLGEVTEFDSAGGPWRRGYLRAETAVQAGDWYFGGHFINDPCMPGTLMFDGCVQAMSFYLAAAGLTIGHDAWRFEPVPEQPYKMRCRGQVTPDSGRLVYEVFVSGLSAGPVPTLRADVLVTVDGVKALHVERLGVQLVPDWPLAHWSELGQARTQRTGDLVPLPSLGGLVGWPQEELAAEIDGFRTGYRSLLACAWGRISEGLGPVGRRFDDGLMRGPRLPGPPYQFMTRVCEVTGLYAGFEVGTSAVAEYDVPDEAWYFEENPAGVMPLSALMEVVLQPCGWLASYAGSMLRSHGELFFRNLDGDITVSAEVWPSAQVIRTRAELTSISELNGMIVESFRIDSDIDGVPLLSGTTVFGYFSSAALAEQIGIPPTGEERTRLADPSEVHTVIRRSGLPGPMLLMADKITGYWPTGGSEGLGRVRAEKTVDAGEWFFKAHFFQDPVMPGSLGVEAIAQVIQWYMLESGLDDGLPQSRFETVPLDEPIRWKYRGQVIPTDAKVTVEADILEVAETEDSRTAYAEAWLWVDGRRIYHLPRFGMRLRASQAPTETFERLDLAADSWLSDHRPTYTVATLPMMSIVDRLCAAAERFSGQRAVAIPDLTLSRWVPVPATARLRTRVSGPGNAPVVTLAVWREAPRAELSRYEDVTTAEVQVGAPGLRPDPFPPLHDAEPAPDPYQSGELFHGPAFQYLTDLRIGKSGSTAALDSSRGQVPAGSLHQGLLDAMTHAQVRLHEWDEDIKPGCVAYPHRILDLQIYEPIPHAGVFRVETRFAGFCDGDPAIDIQLLVEDRVLLALRLVDRLFPAGGLGEVTARERQAFAQDKAANGAGLSTTYDDGTTVLESEAVVMWNSLPGTLEQIYSLPAKIGGDDRVAAIAMKEHVGRLAGVHPSQVAFDLAESTCRVGPARSYVYHLQVSREPDRVVVRRS